MDYLNEDRQWPDDERLPCIPGRKDCRYNLANLSREEFFWLAEHRPELNMPSIYALQFTFRMSKNRCYRKPRKYEGDWLFHILRGESSYHSSLETAEKALHEIIREEDPVSVIHSVTIKRIPVDVSYGEEELEWWLYDNEGNLVDRSLSSPYDNEEKGYFSGRFMGRNETNIRFKRGDIIEMLTNDTSRLVIVSDPPISTEEVWARYKNLKEKRGTDFSSYQRWKYIPSYMADYYFVMDPKGSDIDWPTEWLVAPTLPVTVEARKRLREALNRWLISVNEPPLEI